MRASHHPPAVWLAFATSALLVLSAAPALAQPQPDPAPADPPKPEEPKPEEPKPEDKPKPEEPKPEDKPKPEEKAKDDAAAKDAKAGGADASAAGDADKKEEPKEKEHKGSFEFGSYGRVVAAWNGEGGPGRDADIVAHGSRMDEDVYGEIELRREDDWETTGIHTNVVATLAVASPVFHYDGDFSIAMAVRNLYLEGKNIGIQGFSLWAGSRMVRGDDIYLLDFWPLDNLNLLGAGAAYRHEAGTAVGLNVGATQPDSVFFRQTVVRAAPLDQFGAVSADLLDRQKVIASLRVSHDQKFGERDKPGPGIKAVLYGEGHGLPDGVRETKPGTKEQLPSDGGFVAGGQVTLYTGERDTFIHLWARYAGGLAAFGQFATPGQLAPDKTTDGAHEVLFAAAGNVEYEWFGVMMGAYARSFRDASERLNFEDVDEGIIVARPTFFIGEIAGVSLEGAFEMAQRGVITADPEDPSAAPEGPFIASLWRVGLMPFISPAGRGNFSRPHIRAIYNVAFRDESAKLLYPVDDGFRTRSVEHFIGLGAEWWFNSSSYGF
ncbi:MAG: hypothetical protein HOV80_25560 [Polyangiaceae bacterium]|nr:hypothetical protein [Polyangiaceae bacterium]